MPSAPYFVASSLAWRQSWLYRVTAQFLIILSLVAYVPAVNIQAADIPASQWVTVTTKADPMMQNLTIPADAAVKGMWSSVQSWPLNGLHAAVLPDGRVLTYGSPKDAAGTQNGRYFDIWDASLGFGTNSHQTTYRPQQQDSFCSNATFLSDGRLIISGGNGGKTSTIFSPVANTIETPSYNLALNRWYPTMINLPDGRPLMLGGMVPYTESMVDNPDQAVSQGLASMTPEVLEANGWRSLFGAASREAFGPDYLRASFPHAFIAPNGLVFGVSSDKMWYLDVAGNNGNGAITYMADYKRYSAANPVNAGVTSNAVMYAPGKILIVGGNGSWVNDTLLASNKATVIDINGQTPVMTEQTSMTYPRRMANAIVLANGQVVVTGGTKYRNNTGVDAVYDAEIWDPADGNWTIGAKAKIFRGYHSNTALMPNGTVLSTGGGAPGPVENLNAEIFYPPYLFKSVSGVTQLATRPVIKAISGLKYANSTDMQLDMGSSEPLSQLVLIGLSKGTHAFNTGQRRIPLSFSQESIRLTTALPDANLAPPGYYQVVAINESGVPSLGAVIAIGQNQAAPPVSTLPYTPPDLNETVNAPIVNAGANANYSVTALDGVTYSWNFGDGSADTPYSSVASISHQYAQAGAYVVTLTAKDSNNYVSRRTFLQAVATSKTANSPSHSSPILNEVRSGSSARVWVANPDNDSVSVMDATTKLLVATISVGVAPRSIARAPDGRIWVTNKTSATISIINPTTLAVAQTISLPRASQPYGIVFSQTNNNVFVVLEATGQLLKLDAVTGVQQGVVNIGAHPRHLSISADATKVLVSRFITPPMPGESTASVSVTNSSPVGAEVVVVNSTTMLITNTILLKHSDKTDTAVQGSGIPNYLSAAVISPDGSIAWVPSKQDNIKRGVLRNGLNLDFQNTVRAISSRINMTTLTEDYAKRIDHDNSSLASAAIYHPSGVYLFTALETSRQVAVVDAIAGYELFRINVGRAPQGLALSADGLTLYVHEFMDRSIASIDLKPLLVNGELTANIAGVTYTVSNEKLPANIVLGKQFFYDAKDARLARDSYMSCASCHNDGGHDGRVWDLTGFGEGLRNTIALKGRSGMAHGFLHWSANFDEIQDFEKQIRDLAGGLGLMSDTAFNSGTRNQSLGDKKAGLSTDLDELSAYVASLNTFEETPYRNNDGSLTATAAAGKVLFNSKNCLSCHAAQPFTVSLDATTLKSIGTIKPASGKRLNATLSGIDVPTLRDVWSTAPYLHDGSASTLSAAIQAHADISLTATELNSLVAYMQQIGSEENTGEIVNAAPVVAISSPAANITITQGAPYVITAKASDADGTISKVELYYNDNNLMGTLTQVPYTIFGSSAFVPVGTYTITAKAYDDKGAVTTSAPVNITIVSSSPSNVLPSVSIAAPSGNITLKQGEPYTITAAATDSDGAIIGVEILYDGSNVLATLTEAPYSMNGSTAQVPAGAYSITARAYDNSGGVTTSAPIMITITPP